MEFDKKTCEVVCECGCRLQMTTSMAGVIMGSVRSEKKSKALQANTKLPKPGGHLRKQILELSDGKRVSLLTDLLLGELSKEAPVKRPRGRPKKSL